MNIKSILPGTIAGIVSSISCMPLDVIVTNMQIYRNDNFRNTFLNIFVNSNLKGFYKGSYNTILAKTTFHTFYFLIYNYLINENYNKSISGYSASLFGSIVSNPFFVLKIREQTSTNKERFIKSIVNKDWIIFYKGLFL